MPSFEYDGKIYETDEDGYLLDLDDWNEDVAGHLAEKEGVVMTPDHWMVVNFLREYFLEYKILPMLKILVKAVGNELGEEKGNTKFVYDLFSNRPKEQGAKIAGLPKPTSIY